MPTPPQLPIVDAEPDAAVIKAEPWTDGDASAGARVVNAAPHVVQATPVVAPVAVQAQASSAVSASAASVSYDPAAHDAHVTPDSRDAPIVEPTQTEEPKPEEKPAEPAAPEATAHPDENNLHPDDPVSGHDTPTDQNSDHS